jgi:hypothetical protein
MRRTGHNLCINEIDLTVTCHLYETVANKKRDPLTAASAAFKLQLSPIGSGITA